MMRRLVHSTILLAIVGCARPVDTNAQLRREVWGFTGPWDAASNTSLRDFGGKLDAVITGWIALDSATALPILPVLFPDTIRPRGGAPRRMALVTSWHGTRFHTRPIRTLARDRTLLSRAAGTVASTAAASGYRGLVLDFEGMEKGDVDALVRVVGVIADSARRRGLSPIVLAIPATDTEAYPARKLLTVADLLLVMLYDQHWAGSEPGPISDPLWVRNSLALRIGEAGPDRLVAALPLYGYHWKAGAAGEPVAYRDAERIATAARTTLQRDQGSQTLRASSRGQWDIWVTDASLLRTLVAQTESAGVRRFALWRLGQEDPAVWSSLIR
jgi:peptidoglycan-N-acetylglucosamine deacetylase